MKWKIAAASALIGYCAVINVYAQPTGVAQPIMGVQGGATVGQQGVVNPPNSTPGTQPNNVQNGSQSVPPSNVQTGNPAPNSQDISDNGGSLRMANPTNPQNPAYQQNQTTTPNTNNMQQQPEQMQMPSMPNQSMVPSAPMSESVPQPTPGSMQN